MAIHFRTDSFFLKWVLMYLCYLICNFMVCPRAVTGDLAATNYIFTLEAGFLGASPNGHSVSIFPDAYERYRLGVQNLESKDFKLCLKN